MTGNGFLQLRSVPFARSQFSFLPIPMPKSYSRSRMMHLWRIFSGDQQVWVDGKPDQEERRGHRAETGHDQEDDAVQAVPAQPARRAAQLQGDADAAVVMLLTFILINISIPSAPTLSFPVLKQNIPFLQILPAAAFLFFFRTDSADCLPIHLNISVFHFLVVGSVR